MKHLVITLALVATLAAGTAVVSYRAAGDRQLKAAVAGGDSLEWLRHEFALNEAQFGRIKALHDSYSAVCEEHCLAIQQAMRVRDELARQSPSDVGAMAAAELRLEQLSADCETAISAHVRACAEFMSPEQATRYLALVLPRIPDFDHQAAPGLQVSGHQH